MTSVGLVGAAAVDRLLHRDPVASVFSGKHSEDSAPLTITVGHERTDGARREVFLEWVSRLTNATAHPHLANCVSAGLTESGRPYLALQTTRRTLNDVLDEEGPLPTGQVRAFGVALADALAHYHSHGLIHGAVQPGFILVGANKMLQLTGYDNTAPVLARPLPASVYTAPEHLDAAVAGEVAASPASDVYALGTVLYTALGGTLPWARPDVECVCDPLVRAAPVGPIRGVSPAVTDLVSAALSPEPQHRPTAFDLAANLSGVDVSAIPAQRVAPSEIPSTQLPRTGLRPVTVSTSTDLELYEPKQEPGRLRRRLRKITTGTAGLALTGALLGGVGLATYATTNQDAPRTCPSNGDLAERLPGDFPEGTVADRLCDRGGGEYVTAEFRPAGGAGASGAREESAPAPVPLVWKETRSGWELIQSGDCGRRSLPGDVADFLGCD
ncbi:protein kinase domain-containing protein [Salininema proteolyticum]|uniref:non-specific serine/threonine protein kinase n=1 Tax=Salininema proteolyticum TaxID=1607685 RepID=A0ABV8TZ51_9ACTN